MHRLIPDVLLPVPEGLWICSWPKTLRVETHSIGCPTKVCFVSGNEISCQSVASQGLKTEQYDTDVADSHHREIESLDHCEPGRRTLNGKPCMRNLHIRFDGENRENTVGGICVYSSIYRLEKISRSAATVSSTCSLWMISGGMNRSTV